MLEGFGMVRYVGLFRIKVSEGFFFKCVGGLVFFLLLFSF